MKLLKNLKKGQALPLNTIVIAILVIVVLLVIIVFFTSSVGESGDAIQGQSVTQCKPENPALITLGYKEADINPITAGETCGEDYKNAIGIPNCCILKVKSVT
jgi:ABC-type Na+ efflux pump permease subunit